MLKKDATIGSQKTLRGLVEAVYRRLVTCSTNLDSAKFTPDQLLELNSFFQRFRAKIEYACAMAFYAWSDKFYIGLNENAAPFISEIPADLENLLKTAVSTKFVCNNKETFNFLFRNSKLTELMKKVTKDWMMKKMKTAMSWETVMNTTRTTKTARTARTRRRTTRTVTVMEINNHFLYKLFILK